MAHTLIDEVSALAALLDSLTGLRHSPPSLFIDLEGDNLSRHGTISILQLYVQPQNHVHLIDVHKLGADAFNVAGSNGQTLKSVLQSPSISKVFFDVRNDSDALYSLFDVRLDNVDDLQLMELATRGFAKKHVNGLKKCIERDAIMAVNEKQKWVETKEKGHVLFDPKSGGSFAVFNKRPLSQIVQSYCVQDVLHLPGLWNLYSGKMSYKTWTSVRDASQARIQESQGLHFNGQGQYMALSPWPGWPTSKGPKHASTLNAHSTMNRANAPQISHRSSPLLAKSPPNETGLGEESTETQDSSEEPIFNTQTSRADHADDAPLHLDMANLNLTTVPNSGTPLDMNDRRGSKFSRTLSEVEIPEKGKIGNPTSGNASPSVEAVNVKDSTMEDDKKVRVATAELDAVIGIGVGSRFGYGRSSDFYDDDDGDAFYNSFDNSESPTDFTACSADDCGYCGHCSY